VSPNLDLRAVKTMKIICKNGEIVHSLERYYKTYHWKILVLNYNESDLSKRCFKCKIDCIPSHFLHRTRKRIGNEKLTDLLPVCSSCIDAKPDRSKKKNERRQFSAIGFNPNTLSESQKNWLISIRPNLRGYVLSKLFSEKASSYKPSKQWVNAQVKKACKWIRKTEKEMRLALELEVQVG
jgi:hypothetical protein